MIEQWSAMDEAATQSPENSFNSSGKIKEAITRIYHQACEDNFAIGVPLIAQRGHRRAPGQAYPVFPSLYGDGSGISIFLAAYYVATRHPEARQIALRSLLPLRERIAQIIKMRSIPSELGPIGGLSGIASCIYTLSQLAAWLDEPELLITARGVADTIPLEYIASDTRLDVVSGCAGTLLSLLSFIEQSSRMDMESGAALDLALAGGQRLLDHRVSVRSLPKAWAHEAGPPLSGFGYGAAGIAYALLRLFERTKQERFLDAAIEGFAFERSLYMPDQGAWLDLRSDRPVSENSWSEGAPGIALSRLGSISIIDLPPLRYDLEEALNITRVAPLGRHDHLSCGNFGCIDIMHTAGEMLGRLHLTAHARHLAENVLSSRAKSGLILGDQSQDSEDQQPGVNQSLLLGLAGIGYVLLRILCPGELPSMLLLQLHN